MQYGVMVFCGKRENAHRLSYKIHVGNIPDGMFVLHRCDTPQCVRPDHLFLGTNRDNVLDMKQKGRMPNRKGEAHHFAKLTNRDVLAIRREYVPRIVTLKDLGLKYGVTESMVSTIVRRKRWTHLLSPAHV